MSQFALYAGAFGVPLAYVSGDEALCAETARLFPHALLDAHQARNGLGYL
jgi:D-aminopeptidase